MVGMAPVNPLSINNLDFSYNARKLLGGISLEIDAGSLTALLGPNGAGKTTLFRLCLGDIKPESGEVLLSGRSVASTPVHQLPSLVSFVPQSTAPVFPLTVLDMTLLGLKGGIKSFGGPSGEELERAREAIRLSGLEGMEHRVFGTLSGGEKQLAALTRALVQDAPLMLLDEPTAALDIGHETRVEEMLGRLNREKQVTILLSTHSIPLAARLADRVIVLAGGGIIADGPPNDALSTETIEQAFGVRARVSYDEHGQLNVHAAGVFDD